MAIKVGRNTVPQTSQPPWQGPVRSTAVLRLIQHLGDSVAARAAPIRRRLPSLYQTYSQFEDPLRHMYVFMSYIYRCKYMYREIDIDIDMDMDMDSY